MDPRETDDNSWLVLMWRYEENTDYTLPNTVTLISRGCWRDENYVYCVYKRPRRASLLPIIYIKKKSLDSLKTNNLHFWSDCAISQKISACKIKLTIMIKMQGKSMLGCPSCFRYFFSRKGIHQKNQNVLLLQFSLVTKVIKEVLVTVDPFFRKIGTKRRG